jgi:hypothetical protein
MLSWAPTSFAIEADIGFEQPANIERFANALADTVAELAATFTSDRARRRYHVVVDGHPAPRPRTRR